MYSFYFCHQCAAFFVVQFCANNEIDITKKKEDRINNNKCPLCDGNATQKVYISHIILDDNKYSLSSLFEREENRKEEKMDLCNLLVLGECHYPHTLQIVKLKNE